jgi:hypothetical protein
MPENARRFAALYDQFEDEHRVADWGGDELFTRMPRPRPVDDAPAPRFRPSLVVSEPAAPAPRRRRAPGTDAPRRALALVAPDDDRHGRPARERRAGAAERRRAARTGEQAMRERAERLGLAVVQPAPEVVHRFDESGALIEPEPGGRPTTVITGRPGYAPLPTVRSERRRAPRSPADWIGPRPERIVGWAFALGLLLILIAISTADAATL